MGGRRFELPERRIAIELKQADGEQQVLDSELANKTLTYSGREVTLVLDLDDKGFLISVELF